MLRTFMLLVSMTASGAAADTFGPYSDILVFGDSNSDPGNGYAILEDISLAAAEAEIPSALYPEQQFTNGNVWALQLGIDGFYSLPGGTNFAVSGGSALPDPERVDLKEQVEVYAGVVESLGLGDRPLAAIFIGGNDVRQAENTAEAAVIGTGVIGAIMEGIGSLSLTGVTDFLVFGLPDLGRYPGAILEGVSADATAAAIGFNSSLQTALGLAPDSLRISYFDLFGLFDAVIENPGSYGFTETELPCIFEETICANPDDYVFYDFLHPTERMHSVIAAAVEQELTPIPVPATAPLLISAFGMFILGRRRLR